MSKDGSNLLISHRVSRGVTGVSSVDLQLLQRDQRLRRNLSIDAVHRKRLEILKTLTESKWKTPQVSKKSTVLTVSMTREQCQVYNCALHPFTYFDWIVDRAAVRWFTWKFTGDQRSAPKQCLAAISVLDPQIRFLRIEHLRTSCLLPGRRSARTAQQPQSPAIEGDQGRNKEDEECRDNVNQLNCRGNPSPNAWCRERNGGPRP